MTLILLSITLLCLAVPIYVYAGYPVLLWMMAALRHRPDTPQPGDDAPSVTLVISCYNEADVIREKLDNALSLDYPADRLSIVAVSDGSDDGTDDIVASYADQGIQLIRQEGRLGKTMGLNLAMEQIDSDFVVFSDANALYAPDAIHQLARHFANPEVGYVVGAALYTDADSGASAFSENLYWRYEIAIKQWESRIHSVVGGDGAIYAIRRRLWEPLQRQDINDFVNPLQIIAKGYRGVFDEQARCYEETAGAYDREIARKERIVNRSIRGLMRVPAVMNPLKVGVFAWEVISHKLLRWLIPLFAAVGLAGSALLAALGMPLFQLVTAGGLAIVAAAMLGAREVDKNSLPPWQSLPYYFVMVNLYALRGILQALRGETQVTWRSARSEEHAQSSKEGALALHPLWWCATGALTLALVVGYV